MITNSAELRRPRRCFSGSRPPFPSAPSPIRTGSNGRWRRATSSMPASLRLWLEDLRDHGAPRADAMLFAAAHRAVSRQDWIGLERDQRTRDRARRIDGAAAGDERARARVPPRRARRLGLRSARPSARRGRRSRRLPVAVGAASAGHGFRLESALPAFVVAVFAKSRFGRGAPERDRPDRRTARSRRASAAPGAMAAECAGADLEALGGCTFRSDLAALRHETQYSRLFRS